jgi:enoyl-CoA hydratase
VGAITTEDRDGVLVVRLERPPVNALDVETLDELSDVLDEADRNDPTAVVLTAEGNIFSAGADLFRVLQGDADYIDSGIEALTRNFRTLFEFPRPVVAAVNGHALAGGAVLTCACDYRVMAGGQARIGAIELKAGVPFPSWALEVVRYAVNNDNVAEVVYFGHAYEPNAAHAKGLINEVVPGEDLMERALEAARELGAVPRSTFAIVKRALRRPAVEAAIAGSARYDAEVKAAWKSPEVLDAIRAQLEALRSS